MNLNIFSLTHTTRYYLLHPWQWFKELFDNIKQAHSRIKNGWAPCDVWSFDSWFCIVIPQLLRYMADKGSAYPGVEPFDTPEKWHEWLYNMANTISRLQYDDWIEDNNEYSKVYEQTFEEEYDHLTTTWNNNPSLTKEEVRKAYYERCKELNEKRLKTLEDFGRLFFSAFDCYWD